MSYRIKIYIQYHYVYYIYTLCLYLIYLHLIYSHLIYSHLIYSHLIYSHLIYSHLIYSHLIYSHLIYSHLIYSHLIYSHLIYSHLIYSHLIYLPFKFTSIIFQKIRRCAPPHRDLTPPSPLGSTFHIQYRHIHITASRLFHSQQPLRPFSSIGSTFRIQYRSIQTQVSKTPTLHNQALKKKARGVCRGAAALRPLCGFPIFAKILRPFANPNETQYFSKVFFYILLLNNTHPVHSLNLLEFI
mgnify:CR=1 FL=1